MTSQPLIAQFACPMGPDSPHGEPRRHRGRHAVASVMVWWFARNGWSHPIFADLAAFALNEKGAVHTSQLSHIRNQKMRMIGIKILDAFGAVNLAVWAYHHDRKLLRTMRCGPLDAGTEEILERSEWIANPANGWPLDQGGWMMMYLGYITVPGITPLMPSADALREMAPNVGGYLADLIRSSGKDFYAFSDIASQEFGREETRKVIAVAANLDTYKTHELQRDLELLAALAERLDGKGRTVGQLVEEMNHRTLLLQYESGTL